MAIEPQPDPIFAAIEHRRATRPVFSETAADEEIDRVTQIDNEAVVRVLTTQPTTLLGVAAVLRYVCEPMYAEDFGESILEHSLGAPAEWGDAARGFLLMIANVVARLSAR
jgi:hypothetical protein